MTERDKSILEYSEKMCEYCCNFDKEHIGMDCMALCKLTMTLAYAEDYGGNCMFYNVPKEQIIVPPCKVGDIVYLFYPVRKGIYEAVVDEISLSQKSKFIVTRDLYFNRRQAIFFEQLGKTVFLTKEDAEKALKERQSHD